MSEPITEAEVAEWERLSSFDNYNFWEGTFALGQAARTALPRLIAERKADKAELERLRGLLRGSKEALQNRIDATLEAKP